jgi:hypothetical protein
MVLLCAKTSLNEIIPLQKFKNKYFWLLLPTTNSFKVFISVTRLGSRTDMSDIKRSVKQGFFSVEFNNPSRHTTNTQIHTTEPK